MSDEELLKSIKDKIKRIENLTDNDIEDYAFEEIKSQKKFLPNKFFTYNNHDKIAIFLAGPSGAGKTETAEKISENLKIDIVDTDRIRQICSGYTGEKANLFQKAASRGVSILLNHAFTNNLSFILDGNFAEYNIQKENIERAIGRGYQIDILFVYRDYNTSKKYTEIREKKEGRKVPESVFNRKFEDSMKTTLQIAKEYQVSVKLYDLKTNKIYHDTNEAISKISSLLKQKEWQHNLGMGR